MSQYLKLDANKMMSYILKVSESIMLNINTDQ